MFAVVPVVRIGTGAIHFTDLPVFQFDIYFVVLRALYYA